MAKNVAEIRELAKTQFGRDPQSIKFLALICPVLGRTEEEAQEKFKYYRSLGSIDGALALFGGWTGINLDTYGDDQELRHVESNAIRYVYDHMCLPGIVCLIVFTVLLSRDGQRPRLASISGLNPPSVNISLWVG